jgi:hypothetical protein
MSATKTSLPLALIVALTLTGANAEEAPGIGDRTPDGFVVKCYWTGIFDQTEWFGGQGELGVFGTLLSPPNGTQKSHVFFFATQEVDDTGQMRTVLRDAQWSSTVSHLHYWSRANDRPGAGPGGSGSGAISADDLQVSATDGQKTTKGESTVNLTVTLHTTSDAYKFDVRYNPLEEYHVAVRVSSAIKTMKWDANIFGLSVSDEPVKMNKTTVIRREWDLPGTNFRARWLVTRECETAIVHLVAPTGSLTQYVFNDANPGVLEVTFKAASVPSNDHILRMLQDKVRFKMEDIGTSKKEWDAANPDGKPNIEEGFLTAKLRFTGLPAKNDDFGKKKVELVVNGTTTETARVKVFFPKLAANHPGGKAADPNWFYYWQEGNVCGIAATDVYDANPNKGWGYSEPSVDSIVRLCQLAPTANSGPEVYHSGNTYGSLTVTGVGLGIKCVAETLEHERHHILIYQSFHNAIAANAKLDVDGDEISAQPEGALDGVKSDPSNGDTFNMGGGYSSYGDNEVRCRKVERALTIHYYPSKDWASPGCQWLPVPYGPSGSIYGP